MASPEGGVLLPLEVPDSGPATLLAMASFPMGLKAQLVGCCNAGERALVLVEWMTGTRLERDLIDVERSRQRPTLDGAALRAVPQSLVRVLTASQMWTHDAGPSGSALDVEVRADGTVHAKSRHWKDWRQVSRSVGDLLLGDVLSWIQTWSPAARRFTFAGGVDLVPPVSTIALEGTTSAADALRSGWYVADDALVLLVAEYHGARDWLPQVHVFGRRRAAIDDIVPPDAVRSEWVSVERAMEPAADNWHPPRNAFPGTEAANAGHDLIAELTGKSPIDALVRFLAIWYGIDVEPPNGHGARGVPTALGIIRAAGPGLFLQERLLDPSDTEDVTTPRWFLEENQGQWSAGFDGASSVEDPVVLLHQDHNGPVPAQFTVAELLLRMLIAEATLYSPVTGDASAEPALIADKLKRLHPVAGLPGFRRPAFTDGRILVVSHRFAAHQRQDVADSPIGELPRLSWSYADRNRPH